MAPLCVRRRARALLMAQFAEYVTADVWQYAPQCLVWASWAQAPTVYVAATATSSSSSSATRVKMDALASVAHTPSGAVHLSARQCSVAADPLYRAQCFCVDLLGRPNASTVHVASNTSYPCRMLFLLDDI